MMPFGETLLSVTLNAAGIVPSTNNRFPLPNVSWIYLEPELIDQIKLHQRLNEICTSVNVQIRPLLLLEFADFLRKVSA